MAQSSRAGSCLCGGIKFNTQGEPLKVLLCYCTDCQKNAGASYQMSAMFPRTAVNITQGQDLLGVYIINETHSGHEKHKVFCKNCGCTMWTIPMHHKGEKYAVRTSLLDGGLRDLKPQVELFTTLRPEYLEPAVGTKQFETMV